MTASVERLRGPKAPEFEDKQLLGCVLSDACMGRAGRGLSVSSRVTLIEMDV
jgi:hypothetical protein